MVSEEQHELVLSADLARLRDLTDWLELLLSASAWWPGPDRPAVLGEIELALNEVAANSVRHSQSPDGLVSFRALVTDRSCTIEVSDRGVAVAVDDVAEPDPNEPQVGGYGLMIVRQLTSQFDYERHEGQNTWRLCFTNPLLA